MGTASTTVPNRSVHNGQGIKPARGPGLKQARGQGLPDGFFLTEALNADDDIDSIHDHSIVSGSNQYPGNNKGRGRGGVINNRGAGGGTRGAAPAKSKANQRGGQGLGRGAAGGPGLARAKGQGLFGSDDPVLSRVRRRLEEGNTYSLSFLSFSLPNLPFTDEATRMEKELLAHKHAATSSSARRQGLGARPGLGQRATGGQRQGLGPGPGPGLEKGVGGRSAVNKRSTAYTRPPPLKSALQPPLQNRKRAWADPTTQTAQRQGLGVGNNKGGRGGALGGGPLGANGSNGAKARASANTRNIHPTKSTPGQGLGPGLASGQGLGQGTRRGQGLGKGTYAGGALAYVHGQRARASVGENNGDNGKGDDDMTDTGSTVYNGESNNRRGNASTGSSSMLRKSRTTGAIRAPLNDSPSRTMIKNMVGSSSGSGLNNSYNRGVSKGATKGLNVSLTSNNSSGNESSRYPIQGAGRRGQGLGPGPGVVRKGPGLVQGLRQRRGQGLAPEPIITLERVDSEAEYRAKAGLLPSTSPR